MSTRVGLCVAAVAATIAIGTWHIETPIAQAANQAPAAQPGGRGRTGDTPAPARQAGEGRGPFKKLVIRSVTVIDGTGGPPLSPMDIMIEGNRITSIRQAGWPGLPQQ